MSAARAASRPCAGWTSGAAGLPPPGGCDERRDARLRRPVRIVALLELASTLALAAPLSTAQEPANPPAQETSAEPKEPLTLDAPSQAAPISPKPFVAPASDEGQQALARFQVADGFQVSLWAAEPRLANPVCLYVADRGEVYVAETFRHHAGVTDIRDHMDWLEDDLRSRTVEDRVAMFQRHLGEKFGEYETQEERVRLLRDTDGDRAADFDAVFADGFRAAPDGIGAGLLAWQGDVFYTCMPSLWRLRDNDGDSRADVREALSTGYGVRVALLGHDLHGLRIGPDGRLYFSCGDRGFSVRTREGALIDHATTGAVLRCELDGSQLEVFATGLRNPQELAFDDFGELFTGDNNSDGGDRARIVHVVEGGDSGWRQAYQWLTEPDLRGPWNDERLWYPAFPDQAAYIVPPIANLADGPSGFTCYPGTGFGPEWNGRFFLVDFRGAAELSGVHTFALEPKGASYELADAKPFLWKVLATDADFGPDGALWVLDWTEGWNKTGKGRIYRVESRDEAARAEAAQTRALLAGGMQPRPVSELASLLAHADRRVRQEAELELVARGSEGVRALSDAAYSAADLRARLHAIWGLGIAARRNDPQCAQVLWQLLLDPEAEVRANAARALGDAGATGSIAMLEALLADPSQRVQLKAAIALGRLRSPSSIAPLVELLRRNDGADPVLRHAAVQGLLGCANPTELVALVGDASPQVRLGAVVALRRLRHLGIVPFLADLDERVALEAARAVYDEPIDGALAALASRLGSERALGHALVRRLLCANWRLGGEQRAQAVAALALDPAQGELERWEALHLLGCWIEPPGRDPLTGEWRPVERELVDRERAPQYVPRLVAELGERGIGGAPERVALEWLALARQYATPESAGLLEGWARDVEKPPGVRAEALELMARLKPEGAAGTLQALLFDEHDEVRAAAMRSLAELAPDEALPLIDAALERGGIAERRAAYAALAKLPIPAADERLARELERLDAGLVPAETALDLALAAERRGGAALLEELTAREARRSELDPVLAPWLDCLYGGDPARGRKLFVEQAEITCLRCHRFELEEEGSSGGAVGPDLHGVGARLPRVALLEAITDPNRRIADGYRSTLFVLDDGSAVDGRLEEETAERVRVRNSQDEVVELEPAAIVERREGLSAMPTNLAKFLTRPQMRDLLAFLAGL
jgi:quinoprotein glucose dehydrogenase